MTPIQSSERSAKLTLGCREVDDVAVALEHVDLLDGLDGLDVELLQGGLELLVVTAGALVDLLDLPARSTLASITIIIRQRGALDPLSHAKKSKAFWRLGAGRVLLRNRKSLPYSRHRVSRALARQSCTAKAFPREIQRGLRLPMRTEACIRASLA